MPCRPIAGSIRAHHDGELPTLPLCRFNSSPVKFRLPCGRFSVRVFPITENHPGSWNPVRTRDSLRCGIWIRIPYRPILPPGGVKAGRRLEARSPNTCPERLREISSHKRTNRNVLPCPANNRVCHAFSGSINATERGSGNHLCQYGDRL